MNLNIFAWLCIALLAMLVELLTPSLFLGLSVFFGSLAAALSSCYVNDITKQLLVFIVTGLLSAKLLRRWVNKAQSKNLFPTNAAAIIGKRGIVVKEIISLTEPGLVKIGGETWTAYTHNTLSEGLANGTEVEVLDIKGCHVIVRAVIN